MITKALSVHQPYGWAICQGFKWIENRTWRPNKGIVGTRIAIHTTKAKPDILDIFSHTMNTLGQRSPSEKEVPRGVIVCSVLVTGFVIPEANVVEAPGHALDPAQLLDRVRKSPWFIGPIAWILADPVVVEPIPAKGRQRIWNLDEEQQEALNAVA